MKMNNSNQELSIKCGKTTNSFEELKLLCKKEADKLLKTIDVSSQSTISVAFWTVDIPELICIGNFSLKRWRSPLRFRFLTNYFIVLL